MKKLIVCLLVVSLITSFGIISFSVSAKEPDGNREHHEPNMNVAIFDDFEVVSDYISKVNITKWNGESSEVTAVSGLTKVLKSIGGEGVVSISLSDIEKNAWITLDVFPSSGEKIFASRIMVLDLKSIVYFFGRRSMMGTVKSHSGSSISVAPYNPNPEGDRPDDINFMISPHTKFVQITDGEIITLQPSDISRDDNIRISGFPKEMPKSPDEKPEFISLLVIKIEELPMPPPRPATLIFEGISDDYIICSKPHPKGEEAEEFKFRFDESTKIGRHMDGERFVISADDLESGDKLIVMITSKQFDGSWEYYSLSVDVVQEFPPPPKRETKRIFGKFVSIDKNIITFKAVTEGNREGDSKRLPLAKDCRFMRFSKREEPSPIDRDEINAGDFIQMIVVELRYEGRETRLAVIEITVINKTP